MPNLSVFIIYNLLDGSIFLKQVRVIDLQNTKKLDSGAKSA